MLVEQETAMSKYNSHTEQDISKNKDQKDNNNNNNNNNNNHNNNNNNNSNTVKMQQENIFKTLANKIKYIEMNQSIAMSYLEETTGKYLNILKEIKTTICNVEKEHVTLSKAIHKAAKRGATLVFFFIYFIFIIN